MKDSSGNSVEHNLANIFFKSAASHAHRLALECNDSQITYANLALLVKITCNQLGNDISNREFDNSGYVGLLTNKTITTYVGVLSILSLGKGYLPLSPVMPIERNSGILNQANITYLIVDEECNIHAQELQKLNPEITIIVARYELGEGQCIFDIGNELSSVSIDSFHPDTFELAEVSKNDNAYMMFTSGSTGKPKGVIVNHANIISYINHISRNYTFTSEDKFSQMFETIFDPSVHDMFVCWGAGACLCIPDKNDQLLPLSYIKNHQITVWFSVPSIAAMIDKYGRLKPDAFPSIRYTFFSGEALPDTVANNWSMAAPNSKIINLYGPTETTITITSHEWSKQKDDVMNGLVAIGKVYELHEYIIIDEQDREINNGEIGELCLAGAQVTSGYLNNIEESKKSFVNDLNESKCLWYKTGDLVIEKNDIIYYLGRKDSQIKLQGHRIELSEIESVIRKVTDVQMAVCLPIKLKGEITGIAAFIEGRSTIEDVKATCKKKLSKMMIPEKICFIDKIPLNINGKVDRNQLSRYLDSEQQT